MLTGEPAMKPMHKINYANGAYRTMRADSVEEVVERLTAERTMIGKTYESLGVVSIEKEEAAA